MSTTIDQRVVEMRFDNKHFENNVQTTMSTLDRLKQSLNLTGASKGLENVNAAASKVNFSGITSGIETVQAKFSYMQATIQHQINRIVDSTINAGKRMASALTIDPIKSGFAEYETQINAVQTILANTSHAGTTLQDVNKVLDDLNLYADKTIYNFTEMTRNIGTFTAAGLGLEESASAIKGIANLAAVSGSTSQQASTAMYQLSQALANGRVNLQDWNSVVNAGMGGKVFQDALVRTAAAMKGVSEETFRAQNITGSFRESLSSRDGSSWLSTEVLSKTLQQFTGDLSDAELAAMGFTEAQIENIQKMAVTANEAATKVKTFTQLWDTLKEAAQSGWTQSWEIMVGDFEEAKEELTKISEVIGGMLNESAERRNTLLTEGLSSGWKQLLAEGITDEEGYKESIEAIAKEHGVAFDEIIRKTEEAGGSFEDALITSLKDGKINSDILSESVTHLADKMRNMSAEEKKAAGYTDAQIKSIEKLEAGLKDGSISMDEFVTKMTRLSGRQNIIQALWNSFNALLEILKPIREAFREVFPPITGEQLYAFTEGLRKLTENFKISDTTAQNIKRTFKGLFSLLDIGVEFIKAIAGGAADLIKNFTGIENGILGVTASIGDYISNFRDSVKETNLLSTAVEKITGFISLAIDKIKEFGKSVKIGFETPGYEGFIGFLKFVWDFIKKISLGAVEMFSSLGTGISDIFSNSTFFDAVNSGLFAGILATVFKFSNGLKGPLDAITGLFEGLTDGSGGVLENIKGILGDVRDTFKSYQDQLQAETLKKIAIAIGVLAASIFVISTIDGESLEKSLGAITVLFAELLASSALFTKISTNFKGAARSIAAMISISIAIAILAGALKTISTIDAEGILNGVSAIGILMAELSIFLMTAKLDGKLTGTAFGVILLSTAMLILAKAVKNFGSMNWDELGKGLISIGALLAELAIFTRLSGNAKHVMSTGVGLIAIAAAMKIFASAMKDFSGMSWDEIARGLAGMGGALVELAIATNLMPKNMVSMGVGLIAVGAAMKILASALSDFSGMSWDEIARGLVAMGGALAELVIALNLMNGTLAGSAALIIAAGALSIIAPVMKTLGNLTWGEIAKGLTTLAGAFVIIGVAGYALTPIIPTLLGLAGAFALFGVATLGIGAGLTLIGVGVTALATALTAGATSIVASITVIIMGIIGLIPAIATELAKGIVIFIKVLGESASIIADSLLKLVSEVLKSLATYTPQIVDSLLNFLIGILNSLADKLPQLIVAAVRVIGSFFQGIVDALSGLDTSTLLKGIAGVGLLSALMIALSYVAGLVPGAMVGVLGMGVLIAELAIVLAAVGAIAQIPGLNWLIKEGGNFLELLGTAIGQFIGGLAGGIASGFSSSLPKIGANLSAFMMNLEPFIDGAKAIDNTVLTGVKNLVEMLLLVTAANVVDSIAGWITGKSSMSDFGDELVKFGESLSKFSSIVSGNVDSGAVEAAANAGQLLSELANSLPNSGGMKSWFAGDNNIASFGDDLILFGESITKFSDTISGKIDSSAVEAAANAGKVISEMAATLPNSGGVISWFTADNDMSTFGRELVIFGNSMKKFSDTISGKIDPDAVTAAANAGKTIAEMANTLPESGGFLSVFAADNDISTFARELVPFGKAMAEFSNVVKGKIDKNSVESAANAGKILAEMAATLPSSGGFKSLFSSDNDISTFASQLTPFGNAIARFSSTVDGKINKGAVEAAANASKLLGEMANTLPKSGGFKNLFSSDNDMTTFAAQLTPFGNAIVRFSNAVDGKVNKSAVESAANAGKVLSEMANTLPESGGFASIFTSDNDMSTFASELIPFGNAIARFSNTVDGKVNKSAVESAANAGKILAEMSASLPSSGGFASLFTADNDMTTFAAQLTPFGNAIANFSSTVDGKVNGSAVEAAANAGKVIAEMSSSLPSSGGFLSMFMADNDISTFSAQLTPFGNAIARFSEAVAGKVDESAVEAAANAGKIIAEMANTLPESGGFASIFTADNDMTTFGNQLVPFGTAIRDFSNIVTGNVNEEAVKAAANAGDIMAQMAATLPTTGGITSWFTGSNDMSTFGNQLYWFGKAISDFSSIVTGNVNEESVNAAANAGATMAQMAANLPEFGGLMSWFTADNDMTTFGNQLVPFGRAIANFSSIVTGNVNEEAVQAAANAGKTMAEMSTYLTSSGGVLSWFTADNDMSTFASQLVPFGRGIANFSSIVNGTVNEDSVQAAANAGKIIAEMASTLPTTGGIMSWFNGDNDMESFGRQLVPFGRAMKNYSVAVEGLDATAVDSSISAAKALSGLAQNLPTSGGIISWFTGDNDMGSFANNLVPFGRAIKNYSLAVLGIDISSVDASISAAKKVSSFIRDLDGFSGNGVEAFKNAIATLGKTSVSKFIDSFKVSTDQLNNVGGNLIKAISDGISSKKNVLFTNIVEIIKTVLQRIKEKEPMFNSSGVLLMSKLASGITTQSNSVRIAATSAINNAVDGIRTYYDSFFNAGSYLVDGFASGISANSYKASAKAAAMASAAYDAAKEALDINSPSKIFRSLGYSVPEGFAMGIDRLSYMAKTSAVSMADVAIDSVKNSISRIAEAVNADIDTQPTIRPVLDLSAVESGAGVISGLFNNRASVGVMANVGSINTMMNRRVQNGVNSDIISAIDKLRNDMSNMGNTYYTIDGITYSNGTEVADAITSLTRAIKMEGRV